jgi:hypothetical protein
MQRNIIPSKINATEAILHGDFSESNKKTNLTDTVNILMVSPYLYPKIGGVEKFVYELSKKLLVSEKYKVSVVTANTENDKYFVSNLEGIDVYHIQTIWKL